MKFFWLNGSLILEKEDGVHRSHQDKGEDLRECLIWGTKEETGILIEPKTLFDHLDKYKEDKDRINRIYFFSRTEKRKT